MKTTIFLLKNSKWRSFIFFLFIASFLWLLTKISKEFAAPITTTIKYTNVPETVSIKETNADEVTFNLFANGYKFLGYKLKRPILNIDISKFRFEDTNTIDIRSDQLIKEINEQFPSSRSANTLNLDVLSISVDPIVRKKVPVLINKKVTFKTGFRQIGSVAISPDSIYISGPQKNIALIESVSTEQVSVDLIDRNFSKKIEVILPKAAGISLSNESVTVSWEVKEIAQKEFEIPVKVINKPQNETIKIIPNRVKIRVDITLDHFNDVRAKDFEIICDYMERNTDENFMIAHLSKQNMWAEHIELETQKIDFLIFKK